MQLGGKIMARIIGTGGRDVLVGTSGDDVIRGRGGNDVIRGKGGDDKIFGGSGNDKLAGNGGDDLVKGQGGKDKVKGNNGDDDLYGNSKADKLIGGKGADDLWGGGGGDVFKFKAGDGFHTGFPADPTPGAIFDDVIHDFAGVQQGGTDHLDIPIGALGGFGSGFFDGGVYVHYNDGVQDVGSFFLPGIALFDEADFI
jgi:Ca2+-binding RTX toxin-like protein